MLCEVDEAREVPVRLTCCRELGGRELRRRFATHPPASQPAKPIGGQRLTTPTLVKDYEMTSGLVREECALLFLIRTHILKVCRSHLIAKNC